MRPNRSRARTWILTAAAAAGLTVGAAGVAGAATTDTSSADTSVDVPAASSTESTSQSDQSTMPAAPANVDPATIDHGPGEELLTGTVAEEVTKAALAAEPGATVIRVETDNEGAAYEAHLTTGDGKQVTIKFDESYTVTDTVDGFGGPGPGGGAPGRQPAPSDASA